ncbi:hypothetical protein E2I00_005836 [Balaenoptera physalus]|uniref:G-protein coupled receptors family 1 profile domain-containing protein n=1 Tax=Balaenoptera physalus TaxID=9770 RepID=A0A643C9B7_BALPH|nr:hypothetical protein E2I00_005836 [Balaenoptera physalus]
MNSTSAPKCHPQEMECLHQLTTVIASVSFVVGVVANGLVLWMTVFQMPRTLTTIWFFNLALADVTVLLSLLITIQSIAIGQWLLNDVACKLYMTFLALSFFTSICLLVLISLDLSGFEEENDCDHHSPPVGFLGALGDHQYLCPPHLHQVPAGGLGPCQPAKRLLLVLQPQNEPDPKMLLILWATFSLGCFNSCLNPFLYVFIGRDCQEKFFPVFAFCLGQSIW